MFSQRIPPDREPNEWTRAVRARRAAGARVLDMTETNPTRAGLAVDASVLAALGDARGMTYEPHPRGLRSAREAVATLYAADGVRVDPDALVLTSSTSEAYAHVFRLLCDAGDCVLVPAPSYPLFEPLAQAECVHVVPYRLHYDASWRLDIDSFTHALRAEPRAVVVVQPNNPTGSCLSHEEVASVQRACAERGIAIISDEVFVSFPWVPHVRALPSLLHADAPLTFAFGGLSKSCGLPQMKLGWIAVSGGSDRERCDALDALEWIADLFLSVSTPVQLAAPSLLAARESFVTRARARMRTNIDTLSALTRERPEVSLLSADGGWSAVLRVPRVRTDEEWALALLERDVLVHPGHFYDFAGDGHLVVSLIAREDDVRNGTRRIAALLSAGVA